MKSVNKEADEHFAKIIANLPKEGVEREEEIRVLFMQGLSAFMDHSELRCKIEVFVSGISETFKLTEDDKRKLLAWATDTYGHILTPNKKEGNITSPPEGVSEELFAEAKAYYESVKAGLSNNPDERFEQLKAFYNQTRQMGINEYGEANFDHLAALEAVCGLLGLEDEDMNILGEWIIKEYGIPKNPEILN
jgi:hypothetical protein